MDQNELMLEESIRTVMEDLPPPIRHYLGQGKYTAVAKGLMTKYGLHIDQATILEREIMLLLMGIESPEEFTQTLVTEARLDRQTVSSIVQEVNTQIFVPLREEMMRGVGKVQPPPAANPVLPVSRPQSVELSPAPRPVPAIPTPAPQPANAPVPNYASSLAEAVQAMGVVAPPPQSPKYFHLQNKLPAPAASLSGGTPKPAPVQPQQPAPRPPASTIAPLPPRTVLPRTALGEVLAAVTRTPPEVSQSTAKTPAPAPQAIVQSNTLLEDHEEPHIELTKTPIPAEAAREEVPVPPPPPKTAPPPPNLPGAMLGDTGVSDKVQGVSSVPTPIPPVTPYPLPLTPSAPPPPPQPRPIAPSTPYSADPYREPIE